MKVPPIIGSIIAALAMFLFTVLRSHISGVADDVKTKDAVVSSSSSNKFSASAVEAHSLGVGSGKSLNLQAELNAMLLKDLRERLTAKFEERREFLNFTEEQLRQITDVVVGLFIKKMELEQNIAVVEKISAGEIKVVVPPYPTAGAALLKEAKSSIAAVVGTKGFEEFDDYLGSYLNFRFAGVGVAEQKVTITKLVMNLEVTYRIDWTAELEPSLIPKNGDDFLYIQRSGVGTLKELSCNFENALAVKAIEQLL